MKSKQIKLAFTLLLSGLVAFASTGSFAYYYNGHRYHHGYYYHGRHYNYYYGGRYYNNCRWVGRMRVNGYWVAAHRVCR